MQNSKHLQSLTAIFVTTLLVSNIIAVKLGAFGSFFLPVAVVVFPVSYILGDVLTEVYGYAAMRKVIWTGFFCNLIAVILFWIAQQIPAAPFYDGQEAFAKILGATPRLLVASFIAYLIGSFSNSFVLAKMKILTKGKYLWTRTIGSTLVGEGLDSLFFITLAFYGTMPGEIILTLVITQWMFKCAFEAIATPITYGVVGFLKKSEQLDTYDTQTNFLPIAL